jgi:hypothetical protein
MNKSASVKDKDYEVTNMIEFRSDGGRRWKNNITEIVCRWEK